jgi:hypothetical protein
MASKVLTNEYTIKLNDNIILSYGTLNEETSDVISITVKGKFKPIIDINDYNQNIKNVKNNFIINSNKILTNVDWIENHYIFTTNFTESGIKYNNSYKWKYQLYIIPKEKKNITLLNVNIKELNVNLTDILKDIFLKQNFNII